MRKIEYTAKNDCEISILRLARKMHALLFVFRRTESADFFLSQIIGLWYRELSLHNIWHEKNIPFSGSDNKFV